ncbi:12875_t:CDS:1, partial [Dentiscutata erythropus]
NELDIYEKLWKNPEFNKLANERIIAINLKCEFEEKVKELKKNKSIQEWCNRHL